MVVFYNLQVKNNVIEMPTVEKQETSKQAELTACLLVLLI
jgi:hypothetical protein